jgi:tRNA G26 N,N-dimethylase Trm1
LADELFKLYDHSAIQFANEVYDAIGTLYAKDSTQGRSEIGCWQQAWAKAQMVGLGPQYLGELWNRTVQEAMKLKLKRRRIKFTKSPEAVLRDMFDKLLASIKIRAEKASKELIKAESAMA